MKLPETVEMILDILRRAGYPAYAVGGFDGAVKAVWLLHGTPFAVSESSHGILKKALMEMMSA